VRARLATEAANLGALGLQYWPLFLRDSGAFVGVCGLKPCPYEGTPDAPELELGFHLVPEMWGRGLASEAAAAAASFAFARPHVHRLFAGHHPENHASGAVLRKLGFRYTRHVFYAGTGLLHPLYALERGAV
jgi:RimJ/RimL family protein N-acetyltransferase